MERTISVKSKLMKGNNAIKKDILQPSFASRKQRTTVFEVFEAALINRPIKSILFFYSNVKKSIRQQRICVVI